MNNFIYTSFRRSTGCSGLFSVIPLWLLFAFVLVSCNDREDNKQIQGQPVDISLNVFFGVKASQSDGTPRDRKVTSLRVYAFSKDGRLDNMEYVENGNGLTGDPYLLRMRVLSGEKVFCVVANEPSALTETLQNLTSLQDLKTLVMTDSYFTFNSSNDGLLPFASSKSTSIASGSSGSTVNLSLERAVAKAEVKFIKDSKNLNTVKLVSVQVINTASQSRLIGGDPLDVSSLLTDLPAEDYSSVEIGSSSTDTITTHPVYLFEHLTGAGDAATLRSTVLKVVLNINDSDHTFALPLYVRDDEDTKLNDVLRNYLYRLRATVYSGALRIDYDIAPWNEEAPWDKEPGTNDSNMKFTEWSEESGYDWSIGPVVEMSILEKNGAGGTYVDRGVLADNYSLFQGLPTGHSGPNHLHFAQFSHDYLKYRLDIQSAKSWKIVVPKAIAGKLSFSQTSGSGSSDRVEITAVTDVEDAWNSTFYVEYKDGTRTDFEVYQEGVFTRLPADYDPSDPAIYYYGMMKMNNKFWLDRNLGATVGQDGLNGCFTNQNLTVNPTGVTNDSHAKGVYLTRAQANVACPPGFRLPYKAAEYGEWDWVYNNMIYSGNETVTLYNTSCQYIWYVTLSTVPEVHWLFPICGDSVAMTHTFGDFWSLETGFLFVSSDSGTKTWSLSDYSGGLSVRCVRE